MWERFFEKSKWMSIRLLCSYLAMLVAPLAAIAVFYFQTNSAMLRVQYEKALRLQSEAVTTFERQVNEVNNVSTYLMSEPEIARITRPYKNRAQEFWEKYSFVQSRPDYSLTNQLIKHVYILAKDSNYIICVPTVAPVGTLGYLSVCNFEADSYEELIEELCREKFYGNIRLVRDNMGEENLMMLHSITNGKSIAGVVAVIFDNSVVTSMLENCNPYECSISCILDQDGSVIKATAGRDVQLDADVLAEKITKLIEQRQSGASSGRSENLFEKEYDIVKLDGEKYLICGKQGSIQGWRYISATPVWVLTEQIAGIRFWLVVFSALALLISILICTYHWNKRRSVIRQYCSLEDRIRTNGEKPLTARQGFLAGVRQAFEYIENIQATLALQENLVKATVLRNLLYGNYSDEQELHAELVHARLAFPHDRYYAAVWAFDGVLESGSFRDMVEFRTYIRTFVKESALPFHYIYEVNYNTLAFIFCDASIASLDDIRNLFLEKNRELKEKVLVNGYTGVAEPVESLLALSEAFGEAKNACEYTRYYRMAVPMKNGEIPELTAALFLTPGEEKWFCDAIKSGTKEELEAVLDRIRQNVEEQKPNLSIVEHYRNFVSSTAVRALSELDADGLMLQQELKIGSAQNWDELFSWILEAKQIIVQMQGSREREEVKQEREKLMLRMEERCGDPSFSIADLAAEHGVSESKMYKAFKVYFGRSFSEILENVRIEKACRLLGEGMAVKEVTQRTGYSSDVSFRRAFKRVMGVTPTEFSGKNMGKG